MSDGLLKCPECREGKSFTLLEISGQQRKAALSTVDGDPTIEQAGAVHVTDHDGDQLKCETCGEVVAATELVED